MKRSNVRVQTDLFSDAAAPPALTSLQNNHDQLAELLSKLLWEAVQDPDVQATTEDGHEQDHR